MEMMLHRCNFSVGRVITFQTAIVLEILESEENCQREKDDRRF